MKVDEQIKISNKSICDNIDLLAGTNNGLLAQNILDKLRTFVEQIAVKISGETEYNHKIYKERAIPIISSKSKYKFLYKFHKNLQVSKSHFSQTEYNSESLMIKYYVYLLKIKKLLKDEFDLEVLENIEKFPLNQDLVLQKYYEKIVHVIENNKSRKINEEFNNNYYIWKQKTIIVNNEIYYEITFSIASDKNSKFNRIIAFSKNEILENYAVRLKVSNNNIEIDGKTMPVLIIESWKVSIRPCEFDNFAKIFDYKIKTTRKLKEYNNLMNFLTKFNFNLVEIIDFSDEKYEQFLNYTFSDKDTIYIKNLLNKARNIIKYNKPGTNILRYLLYRLNNKIIKNQYGIERYINKKNNHELSNLKLKYGSIPFEIMPFSFSLIKHNPRIGDLLDCINIKNREHEFFARYIKNNTENNGQLYTRIEELNNFKNIDNLIKIYNNLLYYKHKKSTSLINEKNYIFINGYENDIVNIIKEIKKISKSGFNGYIKMVDNWISKNPEEVCKEKIDKYKVNILRKMFEKSEVAIIYGSAGTGKTKTIEYISKLFRKQSKLFLANTNPAVNNLKNRVENENSEFYTIEKIKNKYNLEKYNIVIIDECSTVNNSDMLKILEKVDFDLLILVGDVYQIESINFGNWFSIIKDFIPKESVYELNIPYRTENKNLIQLWDKVRNIEHTKQTDDDLMERISEYSEELNNSIFEKNNEDEIILCLNYDGLYGINNINRFLQESNPNKEVQWGIHSYKIGDPILFNEIQRDGFSNILYNNLKGKIINIEIEDKKIYFSVEVNIIIKENDVFLTDIELLEESKNGKSKIRFYVEKLESTDQDNDKSINIVPFQVAYAISIHKSQGLEYNSVKIIISDEIDEMITHSIFYTAITRARKELKIYWSPNTRNKILDNLTSRLNKKDSYILKNKFKDL